MILFCLITLYFIISISIYHSSIVCLSVYVCVCVLMLLRKSFLAFCVSAMGAGFYLRLSLFSLFHDIVLHYKIQHKCQNLTEQP